MLKDHREVLAKLNAHNVKYLVVGGHAVSIHAEPRLLAVGRHQDLADVEKVRESAPESQSSARVEDKKHLEK